MGREVVLANFCISVPESVSVYYYNLWGITVNDWNLFIRKVVLETFMK